MRARDGPRLWTWSLKDLERYGKRERSLRARNVRNTQVQNPKAHAPHCAQHDEARSVIFLWEYIQIKIKVFSYGPGTAYSWTVVQGDAAAAAPRLAGWHS